MSEKELIFEIKNSIPDKRILNGARSLSVVNPYNGKLVVLKNRNNEEIDVKSCVVYTKPRHLASFDELLKSFEPVIGNHVIINHNSLDPRGLRALRLLSNF